MMSHADADWNWAMELLRVSLNTGGINSIKSTSQVWNNKTGRWAFFIFLQFLVRWENVRLDFCNVWPFKIKHMNMFTWNLQFKLHLNKNHYDGLPAATTDGYRWCRGQIIRNVFAYYVIYCESLRMLLACNNTKQQELCSCFPKLRKRNLQGLNWIYLDSVFRNFCVFFIFFQSLKDLACKPNKYIVTEVVWSGEIEATRQETASRKAL